MASLFDYLFVATFGSALGLALLFVAAAWFPRNRVTARQLLTEVQDRVAFLFDGEDLLDATETGQDLLRQCSGPGSDLSRVTALFRPGFRDLAQRLSGLADRQSITLRGEGDTSVTMEAALWDGLLRLTLFDEERQGGALADSITIAAMDEELSTLRTLAEDAPQLIWKLDRSGEITWANRAYLDLALSLDGAARNGAAQDDLPSWPPRHVFEQIRTAPAHGEPTQRRVSIASDSADDAEWFEVTSLRRGAESIHFATDANGVVRADRARREFVQTLTKTFADLGTGLIVFDRHRRLVLFNPAFLDLSGLPIEFLSARPVIQSVLDRLREARFLPEPKDYTSWRDQIAELESAARDGTYRETWTLPSGQTLRVTGRPHPDGAIAFLFEDISAEISLTRRFRSELEFGQAVIDNIDEAVAVFSSAGIRIAANRPYAALWQVPLDEDDLSETGIGEAIEVWRARTVPSPTWTDLRDFALDHRERTEWSETEQPTDGRSLSCRFVPLSGGATMVTFRLLEPLPEALRPEDPPRIGLARVSR